jgi:salicylate hydroxylase
MRVSAGEYAAQLVGSPDMWDCKQRMVDPQRLLDELVRGTPPRMVHLNSRISSITDLSPNDGVLLNFVDGTQRVYDIIVGADFRFGNSRQYVLGADSPALESRQNACWELPIRVPYERALQALGPELLGTGSPCQISYLGQGSYLQQDFMGGGKDVLITAMADLSDYHSDGPWAKLLTPQEFGAVFANHQLPICRGMVNVSNEKREEDRGLIINTYYLITADANTILINQLILSLYTVQVTGICGTDHSPAPSYVSRNGALMDDAAHSVLTYKGGNVLVALEEALILSTLLGRATSKAAIPAALRAYDQVCRPRAEEAVVHTREFKKNTIGKNPEIGLNPFLLAPRLQYHLRFLGETNIEAQQATAAHLMDQALLG